MKNNDKLIPVIVVDENDNYKEYEEEKDDLQELLTKIAEKELRRLNKNLDNVDDMESILLQMAKERALGGRLDLKTLQDIIKTMNDSVKRNLSVVQGGKQANLFNIYVNEESHREQKQNVDSQPENNELTTAQRKRVRGLMDAILFDPESQGSVEVGEKEDE